MKIFLRLKHWQLFILIVGLPFLYQIINISAFIITRELTIIFKLFPLIIGLMVLILFSWFYTLGVNLRPLLPDSVKMNLFRFKLFLFIPTVYILFFCFLMFIVFSIPAPEYVFGIFFLILPLHLFSMFCIFYCLYFVSKTLKSVQLQRPITFNDYAGEFFMLWFFFIGVWFIQPRINKLFKNEMSPA
jgi:hypothetical protein